MFDELQNNIIWRDYADRESQLARLIRDLNYTYDKESQDQIVDEFGDLTDEERDRVSEATGYIFSYWN